MIVGERRHAHVWRLTRRVPSATGRVYELLVCRRCGLLSERAA